MKIVSSFKHFEHTPALDEKINKKTQKLKKYFQGNIEVQWTCYIREDGAHCSDIKVLGPNFEYHAGAHADSLYKTFDLVISKVEKQVHKKKDKRRQKISHKHHESLRDQIIAQSERDEQFWEDRDIEDIAS